MPTATNPTKRVAARGSFRALVNMVLYALAVGALIGVVETFGVLRWGSLGGQFPWQLAFEIYGTLLATAVMFHAVALCILGVVLTVLVGLALKRWPEKISPNTAKVLSFAVVANGWILSSCGSWWYDALAIAHTWAHQWVIRGIFAVVINAVLLGLYYGLRRLPPIGRPVGVLVRAAGCVTAAMAGWWIYGASGLPSPSVSGAQANVELPDRPNVLLLVLDTLRADYLSCYGHPRKTSVHLDALAKEGVLFENCITPCGWTSPAHASLFTGLFQSQHHMVVKTPYLGPQFETLAEILGQYGYQTVGVSSNVWVSPPMGFDQGFDTWYDVSKIWGKDMRTFMQLLSAYKCNRRLLKVCGHLMGRDLLPTAYLDQGVGLSMRMLLGWLDAQFRPDRPFFAFVNLMEMHDPYIPPVHIRRRFVDSQDLGFSYKIDSMKTSEIRQFFPINDRKMRVWRQLYEAMLAYVDEQVEPLFDYLRQRQLLDRTVVIVVSDHGEHLGEHNVWGHNHGAYEPLAHVPLIIRYPPIFSGGRRVKSLVQLNDLFRTILSVCRIDWRSEWLAELKDLSQLEAVGNGTQSAVLEFPDAENVSLPDRPHEPVWAYRRGGWKFITGAAGDELYHLDQDPEEKNNLARARPGKVAELKRQSKRWLETAEQRAVPAEWVQPPAPIPQELRRRIWDLGYLR